MGEHACFAVTDGGEDFHGTGLDDVESVALFPVRENELSRRKTPDVLRIGESLEFAAQHAE